MREKFRISQLDFTPQLGKFSIGHKDGEGADLCMGDIVKDGKDQKYFIGYRYGKYMLKQPHTIHSIMVESYERFIKINEVWSVIPGEWLIIGYTEEPLYEQIKDIPDIQLVETN